MEDTIELQELFQIFKKRLVMIITLAFFATIISGAFTHFFITPVYQASTQLVLVPRMGMDPMTQGEISANLQMINTFNEVIVSPMILNEVIEELDLSLTASSLGSRMSAANRSNSQVITLTVQSEYPELARDIANTTAEIFEVEVLENFNMDNVRILARAQLPVGPISPRLTLNIAIGFIIGAMFGIGLAFLLEFLDKTVKTEQEIENLTGIPVLGSIPRMTEEDVVAKNENNYHLTRR